MKLDGRGGRSALDRREPDHVFSGIRTVLIGEEVQRYGEVLARCEGGLHGGGIEDRRDAVIVVAVQQDGRNAGQVAVRAVPCAVIEIDLCAEVGVLRGGDGGRDGLCLHPVDGDVAASDAAAEELLERIGGDVPLTCVAVHRLEGIGKVAVLVGGEEDRLLPAPEVFIAVRHIAADRRAVGQAVAVVGIEVHIQHDGAGIRGAAHTGVAGYGDQLADKVAVERGGDAAHDIVDEHYLRIVMSDIRGALRKIGEGIHTAHKALGQDRAAEVTGALIREDCFTEDACVGVALEAHRDHSAVADTCQQLIGLGGKGHLALDVDRVARADKHIRAEVGVLSPLVRADGKGQAVLDGELIAVGIAFERRADGIPVERHIIGGVKVGAAALLQGNHQTPSASRSRAPVQDLDRGAVALDAVIVAGADNTPLSRNAVLVQLACPELESIRLIQRRDAAVRNAHEERRAAAPIDGVCGSPRNVGEPQIGLDDGDVYGLCAVLRGGFQYRKIRVGDDADGMHAVADHPLGGDAGIVRDALLQRIGVHLDRLDDRAVNVEADVDRLRDIRVGREGGGKGDGTALRDPAAGHAGRVFHGQLGRDLSLIDRELRRCEGDGVIGRIGLDQERIVRRDDHTVSAGGGSLVEAYDSGRAGRQRDRGGVGKAAVEIQRDDKGRARSAGVGNRCGIDDLFFRVEAGRLVERCAVHPVAAGHGDLGEIGLLRVIALGAGVVLLIRLLQHIQQVVRNDPDDLGALFGGVGEGNGLFFADFQAAADRLITAIDAGEVEAD